jgi:hypothetical protein
MSSRNISASSPYCKVCYDAGRPRSEYTSHFVKDQPGLNGKVICPTLLNQACRICGKTGHTSSYCSQYRYHREEQPIHHKERYIKREEPSHQERYIKREPEDRNPYNCLRDDTEYREREIRDRDASYYREQERQTKPWLQAAIKYKPTESTRQEQRREPYAHPHGPRVRLNLEAPALSATKHAVPVIDVRKVELNHASKWGDEDANQPFVCDPEQMTRKFFEEEIMANLTTSQEHDFIAECDDQSSMPFFCGQ